MRILVIAEDRPGWSFGVCRRILEDLGHEAELFNLGEVVFPMAESLFWRVVYKVSRRPQVDRIERALLRRLEKRDRWDLALVCKGDRFRPRLVRRLKETGALVFNWQTDDYFSPTLSSAHAIRSIPLYDCIFAHAQPNIPRLLQAGARRAEYLPHGADPDLLRAGESPPLKPAEEDVVFIGHWRLQRQKFLEELVRPGFAPRLSVWGHEWDRVRRASPLRPYLKLQAIPWEEYGRRLREARINLVFLVRFDTGLTVAPLRLFEIPAAGGFMLVERAQGQAEEFYRNEDEMVLFDGPDDLRRKITHYLDRPEERRRIALAGQKRVVESGYLYTHKMERMLHVYRELRKGAA